MAEAMSYMAGSRLPMVLVNIMRGGPGSAASGPPRPTTSRPPRATATATTGCRCSLPSSIAEAIDLVGDGVRARRALPDPGHDPGGRDPRPGDGAGRAGLPRARPARTPDWALDGAEDASPASSSPSTCGPRTWSCTTSSCRRPTRRSTAREQRWAGESLDGADVVLVAYGTAARIARTAVERAREAGLRAGLFRPITLWPFPAEALRDAAAAPAPCWRWRCRPASWSRTCGWPSRARSRSTTMAGWAAWCRHRTRSSSAMRRAWPTSDGGAS